MWYTEMLNKIIPSKIAIAEAKLWGSQLFTSYWRKKMKIYETKHMSFFWTTFRVFGVCTQIQLELRCASHTHVLCSRCYSSPVYTNMEKLSLFPYWRSQRKKKEGHRVVEIKETKRNNTFWCNTHSSFKAHFVSPNLQIICL